MKSFLSILIALITVLGITLLPEESGWTFRESRSFFLLPLFILLVYGIGSILKDGERRLKLFALIPAVILSLCRVFGSILDRKETILWLLKKDNLIPGIVGFFSVAILLYCLIFFYYRFLSRVIVSGNRSLPKKVFFLFWIVLILVWLPIYLNQFPAIITADSVDQIEMALGAEKLTDHHPVFYTFLIRNVLMLFRKVFPALDLSFQVGVAMFTGLQFLLMTAVFAHVLTMIFRSGVPRLLNGLFLVFFTFYPIHPLYSVTIWKDVSFSVCLLVFEVLLFYELRQHKIRFCVGIAVSGILLVLFRHNGVWLLVLSLPFLFSAFRSSRKLVLCAFLIAILFIIAWKSVFLPALRIPGGEISEALSLPLQQIALTAKRQHRSMDEELLAEIRVFFDTPDFWKWYTYRIADPVKNRFSETYYRAHRAEFWRLWLKLAKTYPQDTIDGFLLHTFGYWYPEMPCSGFAVGIDNDGFFGIHMAPKGVGQLAEPITAWIAGSGYKDIPLISLLFSPGACFWVCLACFFYCLYRKSPAFFLFIPVIILWLTALASPVNCEYRYVYGMFLCIPLLFTAALVSWD